MVKLIDGYGQLGSELAKINREDVDCVIYHTWNIDDSTETAQRMEYKKFVDFVDENESEKIFFISTKQGKQIHYLHYKLKAELYVLERGGYVIRIPKLMGKGICEGYRSGKIQPYAEIEEILTPEDAAIQVISLLDTDKKMNVVIGERIDKRTIYNLIRFGVSNEG